MFPIVKQNLLVSTIDSKHKEKSGGNKQLMLLLYFNSGKNTIITYAGRRQIVCRKLENVKSQIVQIT